MDNKYDFYRERYNDIQRYVYAFLNEVQLTAEEQAEVFKRFYLDTNFAFLESVQEYNTDLLIKGYIKVDFREVEFNSGKVKGKFVESGHYLKEKMIQIPKHLFDVDQESLEKETYSCCVKLLEKEINAYLESWKIEKQRIEEKIERYTSILDLL